MRQAIVNCSCGRVCIVLFGRHRRRWLRSIRSIVVLLLSLARRVELLSWLSLILLFFIIIIVIFLVLVFFIVVLVIIFILRLLYPKASAHRKSKSYTFRIHLQSSPLQVC